MRQSQHAAHIILSSFSSVKEPHRDCTVQTSNLANRRVIRKNFYQRLLLEECVVATRARFLRQAAAGACSGQLRLHFYDVYDGKSAHAKPIPPGLLGGHAMAERIADTGNP